MYPHGWFSDTEPNVEMMNDDRCVRVFESFVQIDPDGRISLVPAGQVCDGASIPRLLWSLIGGPYEGKHRVPALSHDALYRTHEVVMMHQDLPMPVSINRRTADRMFLEGMRARGMAEWRCQIRYWGVRLGGRRGWREGAKPASRIRLTPDRLEAAARLAAPYFALQEIDV
jgi:hypothetical protein